MKITRKTVLNIAAGVAVAATAAIVFLPSVASAAPATATASVNVRSGPGTSYGIVDTLRSGEQVDVGQCQGSWCFVERPGPDGWVSSNYLNSGELLGPVPGSAPGITIPGFDISIGIGNAPPPRRPGWRPPPPRRGEVCFYDRTNFRGNRFCAQPGEALSRLGAWSDRISSVRNEARFEVRLCASENFRRCRVITSSARSLGNFSNRAASLSVD